MSYVVLARKWRPKYFEEVVGQGHVARTLKNSIRQDRVAHAYLFTGARGVGKTSTARILAKALNCHNGPSETPCYECPSCREISEGQAVDVFEIDGASNRGINEIRELREGVRYAPSRDRFKVYIIDEVHMLTTEAFNALLKTLEEPPPHVKFVFATTEPQKIPVTILSRCQRFDFKRISQQDIVDHLMTLCPEEGIEAEKSALQLIARQASGGMRDALSLLDQVISFAGNEVSEEKVAQILGVANRKHLFELSGAILANNAEQALITLDEVHRYGYDLQQFASEMVTHLRDLMVCRVVQNPERVTSMTSSEIESVRDVVAQTAPDLLHRYFEVMVDGAQQMSRSPYPKLLFEMTLVRMCQLEPMVGIDLMIDRLKDLEGTLGEGEEMPPPAKKKSERAPVTSSSGAPAQAASAPQATPAAPTPSPAKEEAPQQTASPAQPPASTPQAPSASSPPSPATPPSSSTPTERPDAQPDQHTAPAPVKQEASTRPTPPRPPWGADEEASEPKDEVAEQPPQSEQHDAPRDAAGEGDADEVKTSEESAEETSDPPAQPASPATPPQPEAAASRGSAGPGSPPARVTGTPPWVDDAEDPVDEEDPESVDLRATADEDEREPLPYGTFEYDGEREERSIQEPDKDQADDEPVAPPDIDVAELGRQAAWKALVDYVRTFRAPLAATLEHAYVEEFTDQSLTLTFLSRYLHFVHDEERLGVLRDAVVRVFGEGFEMSVSLRHDATPLKGFETLAQLRDQEQRRRQDQLAKDTEHHPVIKQAEHIFSPTSTRVLVALRDG